MVELKKSNSDFCRNCVEIFTDEGSFKMYFDPRYDLCMVPCDKGCSLVEPFSYTITRDNRYVYDSFGELYDSIMVKNSTDELKKNENSLVKNDAIEWHSDDFEYSAASFFRISKDDNNNYVITFVRSKVVSDEISAFATFVVHVNSSNSRYDSYNWDFLDLHSKLNDYDLFHNFVLYNNGVSNKKKVRKR